MVLVMKLKHVDELSGGGKRFRRRYPKVVIPTIGEEFFQVPMKAREGADLVTEHEALMREYEKLDSKALRKAAGQGQLSPLEHWREAVKEAEALDTRVRKAIAEDWRHVLPGPVDKFGHDLRDDEARSGWRNRLRRTEGEPHAEATDKNARCGSIGQAVQGKGGERLFRPAEPAVHQFVSALKSD